MNRLQHDADDEHSRAQRYHERIEANEAAMQSVSPLLDEIKKHGRLRGDTVQTLVAKLADLTKIEKKNADLREANQALQAQNMGLEATARDSEKFKKFDQRLRRRHRSTRTIRLPRLRARWKFSSALAQIPDQIRSNRSVR